MTEKKQPEKKPAANAQTASKSDSNDKAKQPSLKDEIAAEMSADLNEQIDETKVDVPKLQKERDELEDKYLRAAAEISNMNNRFKKEEAQMAKYDGQKLATAVLPVLDNLERALATDVSKPEGAASLKKGVDMVHSHLAQALKENGIEEITETKDHKFDPTIQQAVQTVAADKDHPKDTVVSVLQKGYRLKDRVLRPAMVVVAN